MGNFTFKGLFLAGLFMVLGCLSIQAADDDLITRQVTVKVYEAGTLSEKIAYNKMYKITNLKIIGEINGTDLRVIREMAGKDVWGKDTDGMLSVLDLSDAKIVEGGDYYNYYENLTGRYGCSTSNDKIGNYAFEGCSGLTSITLPSGVTSIGDSAFSGCIGLTSITLPSGVTKIGNYAFEGCSGLTSLTLPSGVTKIGNYAFSSCRGLTSLTLPSGVTEIGEGVFWECIGLTSLTLPSGLTKIGVRTFYGCSGLTSLTIPSGVTEICGSAFYGCIGLTSLTLPSGLTEIGNSAFSGCIGLTSLTLPSGLTKIGYDAFRDCIGLTSLTLPSGVTWIGSSTFKGCIGLTSITLPSGLTEICGSAFSSCSGLTSIYVYTEKLPKMGVNVFDGCDAKKCTVYVPKGTYDDYWLSEFGYFENIVEFDPTGINNVITSNDAKELSRYSLNGQRLSAPTKGLNIVKYSDGSVKKVVVQ